MCLATAHLSSVAGRADLQKPMLQKAYPPMRESCASDTVVDINFEGGTVIGTIFEGDTVVGTNFEGESANAGNWTVGKGLATDT